jgi:hypothetical protein
MATISRSGIAASSTISATHITNIIDALDGVGVTTIVATGSFSGSLKGNLTGTASWASNATLATTANGVAFSSITSLPISLTGYANGGVSSVQTPVTTNTTVPGTISNGGFYPANPVGGTITVTLDSAPSGFEFTTFASGSGVNDIQFAAGAGITIISPNGYLKLNGTGSAAVAKALDTFTWALIGNLKA